MRNAHPRKPLKAALSAVERPQSHERWRALAMATGQITWVANARGEGTDLDSWCAFTGQTLAEAAGMGWSAAIHPDDCPDFSDGWQRTLATRESFVFEMRVRRYDGVYRLLQLRGVPVLDVQGVPLEWVGVSIDITEQRAHEERSLQHMQDVEGFLGIISHELRHPLTIIAANGQLVIRQVADALQAHSLDAMRAYLKSTPILLERCAHQTSRMTKMIEELVDVAHLERGTLELSRAPGDIGELVQAVAFDLADAWPDHTITLAIDPTERFPVLMDAHRIEQVVSNLLTNAHKYTPARCAIQLSVTREGSAVLVAVRDEGPGMNAAELDRIWGRYYQVKNADQQPETLGLGLGLYICRTLIERHGGQIDVTSEVGVGTTFWFKLPLLGAR